MEEVGTVKSNIKRYYLATVLAAFGFYTPIIQLFYLGAKLTIYQIAILGVIWTITKMLLEVPSSILADKWGRKKVLLVAAIFSILQLITLIYSRNYWFFVGASIWSAAAFAFTSGTDVAFFYDTLIELKRETEFEKLWARQQVYNQIPFVIAFLTSGFLFKISPILPFQLSLLFLLMSAGVIMTLVEPKFYKTAGEEVKIFSQFKQTIKFIFSETKLRFILLFTLLFSLGSDFSYGYGQIYLKTMELPVIYFGMVFTLKSFLVTLSANITPKLRGKFDDRNLFGLQMVLTTGLFYLMVWTKSAMMAALLFILIAIPHGIFGITKSSYLHRNIDSKNRATIDSMFSFILAMVFLVLEPAFGYLADKAGIKMPFFIIAVIMTGYWMYFQIIRNKHI